MRDEDKPFILYRSSAWSFKIVPRNGAGWRQTLIWMALFAPIAGLFIWFAANEPEGTLLYAGLALYLVATMIWGIGGTLWMKARAEVVDLDELLKLNREEERNRRGGR
jgi:hypothetical protein